MHLKTIHTLFAAVFFTALSAAPASALVRLGAGATAGFALPAAAFDNDAKSSPEGSARLYGNLFHWLTVEVGGDFHLPHDAESKTGLGATRLYVLKAGLVYKVDVGVFKPLVAFGFGQFTERIKRANGWERLTAPGFYVTPGMEYYFTERFAAEGTLGYNRPFDDARKGGRDTQYVQIDFGVQYYFW